MIPAGASVCFLPDGDDCGMSTDYTGNPCSSVCKYTSTDATRMQSNGYNCQKCGNGCDKYKCDKISCPADYSTDKTNVQQCGTSGSNGWELVTSGKSGGKDCAKCNKKTCASGVDETSSLCGTGKDYVPSSTYSGDKRCCVKDTCPTPYKKSCGSDQSKEQKGQTDAGTPCYLCTDITTSCNEGETLVTVKKIKSITIDENDNVTVDSENGVKKCLKCDNSDAHRAYELVGEDGEPISKIGVSIANENRTDMINELTTCDGFTPRGNPISICGKNFYSSCYTTDKCYTIDDREVVLKGSPVDERYYRDDGGYDFYNNEQFYGYTKINPYKRGGTNDYASCVANDDPKNYNIVRRCSKPGNNRVIYWQLECTPALGTFQYDCFSGTNQFSGMMRCPKITGTVEGDCIGEGKMCGGKVWCKQCKDLCYDYGEGDYLTTTKLDTSDGGTRRNYEKGDGEEIYGKYNDSNPNFYSSGYYRYATVPRQNRDGGVNGENAFLDCNLGGPLQVKRKCQKRNGTIVYWTANCDTNKHFDCFGGINPIWNLKKCPLGSRPRPGVESKKCGDHFYTQNESDCVASCSYTQTANDCPAGKNFVKVCYNQSLGKYTGYCE